MSEQRDKARRRVLKSGTIEFGSYTIECTIRNLSDIGAALDVTSAVGIPDHFTLLLHAERVRKSCRVAWRKEKRIAVKFD